MKSEKFSKAVLFACLFFFSAFSLYSQKVAFVASDIIRDKFPEAKQADQRVRSMVDDWKRELEDMDKKIEDLKFEIKKNRLIWSDEEKRTKDKELEDLQITKMEFARRKFEASGEYDALVKNMMQPIEEKIYAAVQQVAADEGYDLIWDKSLQPLAYVNSKYDLTIKVLRKLGVDVKALEKELQEKIDKDPRNQKKDSKAAPAKRTRANETPNKEIKRETDKPKGQPGVVPIDKNFNPNLNPGFDPTKPQRIEIDTTSTPDPLKSF